MFIQHLLVCWALCGCRSKFITHTHTHIYRHTTHTHKYRHIHHTYVNTDIYITHTEAHKYRHTPHTQIHTNIYDNTCLYIYTPNIHTYTSHIHIHTNVSYISQYTFIYTQTPILLQAHTVSTHIPHFIVWSVLSPKAMHKHLCSFLRKNTYPWLFCPAVWVSHGQWKSWMEEHLSDKVHRQQCITICLYYHGCYIESWGKELLGSACKPILCQPVVLFS